jgi:hypothetical protein
VTFKFIKISDQWIKIFMVAACMSSACAIYWLKVKAIETGHKIPDDQWLNWISGVCIMAAAGQFFDVAKVVRMLRGKDK